jgi:hypothetical protein
MAEQRARTKGAFTFLEAEVCTGLTFAVIASQANDENKIRRNSLAAQRAYDTVCHFTPRVSLTPEESRELEPQLKQLRHELNALRQWLPAPRKTPRRRAK